MRMDKKGRLWIRMDMREEIGWRNRFCVRKMETKKQNKGSQFSTSSLNKLAFSTLTVFLQVDNRKKAV